MDFSKTLAFGVSLLSLACGVVVAWGFGIPDGVPSRLRVTMGVILMLLGIYRFAVTRMKSGKATHEHL